MLREIGALEKLLEIIGNNKWNDLHVFALQALANALDDPQSITVRFADFYWLIIWQTFRFHLNA